MHPQNISPFLALAPGPLLRAFAAPAAGQCILANPSFELGGFGEPCFCAAGSSSARSARCSETSHGQQAARVSGPNSGGWDLSGFWQTHDCVPGEQLEVTGHVLHPASNPLTGQCLALVNIEWRDSSGDHDRLRIHHRRRRLLAHRRVPGLFLSEHGRPGRHRSHPLSGRCPAEPDRPFARRLLRPGHPVQHHSPHHRRCAVERFSRRQDPGFRRPHLAGQGPRLLRARRQSFLQQHQTVSGSTPATSCTSPSRTSAGTGSAPRWSPRKPSVTATTS